MSKKRIILGWVAVGSSLVVCCLWAYWGIVENFHEGWHSPTLWQNIKGTFLYLAPMFITMAISLYAVFSPLGGGLIFIGVGIIFGIWIFALWQPKELTAILSWIPVTGFLIAIGVLYLFGRPQPKKLAFRLVLALPLLVVIVFGIEPVWRVAGRIDDGIREARLVEGNGVRLIWAPAGPGWPRHSESWEQAKKICRHLSEDGKTITPEPKDIWRLPTVEEAVRSMARHGQNCGGVWDPISARAKYRKKPDKESPLWDTTSLIIYWWTATEKDENTVYMIVYNGHVVPTSKDWRIGSLGFRAVKEPRKPK